MNQAIVPRRIWKTSFGRQRLALIAFGTMGALVTTTIFWPGYLSYDSVFQLEQAVGRTPLSDWHPPVMALLWALLIRGTGGIAAMAALQSIVLWSALTLIALVVHQRLSSPFRAGAVLAIGFLPPVLTFAGVVWKDVHLAFSLLLAVALMLAQRTFGVKSRPTRILLFILILLLMTYAILVRKNALVAAPPLLILWGATVSPRQRFRGVVAVVAASLVAVVVASAAITAWARPQQTNMITAVMLDDLINVVPPEAITRADISPDLQAKLLSAQRLCARKGSIVNSYWTCYGRGAGGDFTQVAHADEISALWKEQIPRRWVTYSTYRLRLFGLLLFANRDLFQAGTVSNDLGVHVGIPNLQAALQLYIKGVARDLPLFFAGWFWLLLSACLVLWPGRHLWRLEVRCLAGSAVLYILGYLPVVPQSDFRYVYWSVVATTVAVVLRAVAWSRPTSPGALDSSSAKGAVGSLHGEHSSSQGPGPGTAGGNTYGRA